MLYARLCLYFVLDIVCVCSHDKANGPPCRDFLKGLCTRGESCRYHHYDANSLPPCRDFQRGRCERMNDCKFSHDRKTEADGTAMPQQHASLDVANGTAGGMATYGAAAFTGGSGGFVGGYSLAQDSTSNAPGTSTSDMTVAASAIGQPTTASTTEGEKTPGGGSRKRAREADEATAPSIDEAAPVSADEPSDERPSKQLKSEHANAESEARVKPSEESNPETAVSSDDAPAASILSSRGPDGKMPGSSIPSVEGGPSVAGPGQIADINNLAGQGDGGIVGAGHVSAAAAPGEGGPSGSVGSGAGGAPAGAPAGGSGGGAGGPA